MARSNAPLWMVAVLLAGAAAALWGATRLDWGGAPPRSGGALALVALAGFAGAVAAGGWAKRVVGGIVVLAGLLAGWAALAGGSGPGPVLSLVGAAALVVAGFLVIRLAGRLPTLGAKYRSAGARRASGDPDKDLWDGLSKGEDPTVGHPAENANDER